jgi:hypothetical protein
VATRIKPSGKDRYEQDSYVWAHDEAALLRAVRFDALDLEHLIEEVEDLGGAVRRSMRLHVLSIVEHLLKLQYRPASEHRLGGREVVRRERSELLNELTPSLRHHLADNLPDVYARARHDPEGSLRDHSENDAADALPATCPYTLDQITGDWLP